MKETASLILMGGENKRMNGNHKAFLKFNNERNFLEQLIHVLPYPVYLSVNDLKLFKQLPYPMIEDAYPKTGPVGGLYSVLDKIHEQAVFVTACDMPFITSDFADYMVSKLIPETDCVVLSDEEGRLYPLGAVYTKNLLPIMKVHLEAGDYSLKGVIHDSCSLVIPIQETPFSKELLRNINSPQDYEKYIAD